MPISDSLMARVRQAWLGGPSGRLPSGWRFATFDEALQRVERPTSVQDDVLYRQPVIRRNHGGLELREVQLGREILTKKQYILRAGDWLMSKVQIMHRAYGIVPSNLDGSIASGSYYSFVPRTPLFLPFFWYLSHLPAFHLACDMSSVGVVIEKMVFRVEDWLGFEFPLPPLPEQRRIAATLSSVDDAIEGTQAVIDQLQVVKKAMMAELLTRGLPGRHSRFKQTEIGDIPQGWDVVRIGDVCERMFVGIAQAATHAYVPEGGVPIVRSTNVRANRLRTNDVLRINETFAAEMRSKALRVSDVLSARTGYPGTSVVVPAEFDGAQCFTMLVSRPGPRLHGQFLCHLMNSTIGARIVAHGQAGGAQQNLNVGVFEEARVALPPLEEQEDTCQVIDGVYEREWAEESLVESLKSVKSALMSVLLTGEIRVTPDKAAPP